MKSCLFYNMKQKFKTCYHLLIVIHLFILASCMRLPTVTPSYETAHIEPGLHLDAGISHQCGSGVIDYTHYSYKFMRTDMNIRACAVASENAFTELSVNFYCGHGRGEIDWAEQEKLLGVAAFGRVSLEPNNVPVAISLGAKTDIFDLVLLCIPIDIGIKHKGEEIVTIGTTLYPASDELTPAFVYDIRVLTHLRINHVKLILFYGIGTWGIPYLLNGYPFAKDKDTPFDFTIGFGTTCQLCK